MAVTNFVSEQKEESMESTGKRAWKKLEEDSESSERMNKGMRTLPSDIKVAGTSNKKKGKSQVQT